MVSDFRTVVELTAQRAALDGDRVAFRFLADRGEETEQLSYREVDARARSTAVRLLRHAAVGDRAVLLFEPSLHFLSAYLGCLYSGIVPVPLVPPTSHRQHLVTIGNVFRDATPSLVLTSPLLEPLVRQVMEDLGFGGVLCLVVGAGDVELAPDWHDPGLDGDSLAFLQYTSGSTGAPKGVMVTHGNLLANITALATRLDCNEYDVLVSWLPPYHDMGLIGALMMPLYAGMEVVLFSPLEFMKRPLRWLRTIQRYKATVSPAPNFAFDLCTRKSTEENRGALDLSTWRVAAVSAEPISANTLGRFAAAFSPSGFRSEAFVPCYGLAEATLIVTGASVGSGARKLPLDEEGLRAGHVRHPSGDARTQAVVACGAAVDGVRVEVVRPETRESLPERQIGEVWIAGPTICAGYFGRLQETESTFRAKLLDDRTPFLRTGDLGFLDNGELFVVGRKKDLIIVRARKHYPQDIEHTVEQSHDVVRPGCCAAFSIPVDDAEALVVVAEIDPRRCDRSMVATVEELAAVAVDTIRANVAENHALKVHDLVFLKLGSIPKTSSGKIRRTACREAYAAGTLQRASFLERSENRSAEATLANDDGGHRNG